MASTTSLITACVLASFLRSASTEVSVADAAFTMRPCTLASSLFAILWVFRQLTQYLLVDPRDHQLVHVLRSEKPIHWLFYRVGRNWRRKHLVSHKGQFLGHFWPSGLRFFQKAVQLIDGILFRLISLLDFAQKNVLEQFSPLKSSYREQPQAVFASSSYHPLPPRPS